MSDQRSAADEGRVNDSEGKLGPPMSANEVARHFGETPPIEKPEAPIPKTKEEIEAWEKKQDEATDIYKVAARVKNNVTSRGLTLTPVGDVLCNTYVHVLLALYRYAESLPAPHNDQLKELLMKNEDMPSNVISAAGQGLRVKK